MKHKLYGWLCDITHVGLGVIVVLSYQINLVLPIVGAMLFVIYELDEAKVEKDLAYADIREFMYGFFLACGILIMVKLF